MTGVSFAGILPTVSVDSSSQPYNFGRLRAHPQFREVPQERAVPDGGCDHRLGLSLHEGSLGGNGVAAAAFARCGWPPSRPPGLYADS